LTVDKWIKELCVAKKNQIFSFMHWIDFQQWNTNLG
jgi:hypothetical protein